MEAPMNSVLRTSLGSGAILALMACGPADIPPTLIVETGCVTASDDRFVLTDLQPTGTTDIKPGGTEAEAPRPITEAYLLVGAETALREHVGRQVRVSGEAHPERIVEIRHLQPLVSADRATQARAELDEEAGEKHIETKVGVGYQLRLEIGGMLVRAVEPTGELCELSSVG